MYNRCVVIACNSGGPLETVVEGTTGFLLEPQPEIWAHKISEVLSEPHLVEKLGNAGREHVISKFTNDAFADQLDEIVRDLLSPRRREH